MRFKILKIFLCFQATLIAIICFATGCGDKNPDGNFQSGKFYTLSEAYDNGWLSDGDVQNIAYYYSPSDYPDYTPLPKNPETLSAETELNIKQTHLSWLKNYRSDATLDNVIISLYYGTYGDCVAVRVWNDMIKRDLAFTDEVTIGTVVVKNYCAALISIWKPDAQ